MVVGEIDLTGEDENMRSGEGRGDQPHSSLHNLGMVDLTEPSMNVRPRLRRHLGFVDLTADNDGEEGLKGTVKVANDAADTGDDELEMMEVEYLVQCRC